MFAKMRMGGLVLVCSLLGLAVERAAAQVPRVRTAEPLVNLERSVQTLTPKNLKFEVELEGLLPAKKGSRVTFSSTLLCLDGKWKPGEGKAPAFNAATHTVEASGLKIAGDRLTGTLKLVVKPDKQMPPDGKERRLECKIDARLTKFPRRPISDIDIRGERFWILSPESQGPAWRAGGRYETAYDGEPVKGTFSGWLTLPDRPGFWNMGDYDGGLRLTFDLGKKRQNWNFARLAVYEFPRPRDLSACSGLRLRVATKKPRPDVSATVWLREEDGSWYYLKSAVPLVDRENEAVLLFEDFAEAEWVSPTLHLDEDYVLDLRTISHLGVGIVNPQGVGEVPFRVLAIDLVECEATAPPPARLKVTGRTLSVNGHEMVPPGIFGGYAGDLPQEFRPGCQRSLHYHAGGGPKAIEEGQTELFHIDCWGDRYVPAPQLTDPNWEQKFKKMARSFARKAKDAGRQAHLEVWNEPYLNWARGRGARNYRVDYYKVEEAKEGGPVTLKSTGKKVPYFQWEKTGEGWRVIDTTQFTYWSGRGNGALYDEMCLTVARAAKEVDPNLQIIAGWGFRWNEDQWAPWDILYKPTIDRCIRYIDGICEHHYQGDTTAMNGSYEVLVAYAVTKHNKWLYVYNTETNDLVDAPARGRVQTPDKAKAATNYRRTVYNVRDCIYCVLQSPDKIRSRTVIHNTGTDPTQWTAVAYGFMKNLRGRLVETRSDDDRVWCVASIDGTDPNAAPPEPGTHLVVVLFNDHRRPRKVELSLSPPTGATFGQGVVERIRTDMTTFKVAIERTRVEVPPSGRSARAALADRSFELTLPERSAWKVTIPLKGDLGEKAEVTRRQFFAPDILKEVRRGKPFKTRVKLGAAALKGAGRAWLRLVVEDVAPGEATVEVAGRSIPIPKAYTADNVTRIVELPLEPSNLTGTTELEFRANDGNFAGYRVDMVSIVLEARR